MAGALLLGMLGWDTGCSSSPRWRPIPIEMYRDQVRNVVLSESGGIRVQIAGLRCDGRSVYVDLLLVGAEAKIAAFGSLLASTISFIQQPVSQVELTTDMGSPVELATAMTASGVALLHAEPSTTTPSEFISTTGGTGILMQSLMFRTHVPLRIGAIYRIRLTETGADTWQGIPIHRDTLWRQVVANDADTRRASKE